MKLRVAPTLAWFAVRAAAGSSVFRARARNSPFVFHGRASDAILRGIAKYGIYDEELSGWFAAFLESRTSAGVMVDIGANIGWHALHASRHAQVSAVVAAEPDAFNAWMLERNIAANDIDKIVIAPWAIGDRPGIVRFNRFKQSNSGRHSVLVDHGHGSRNVAAIDLDTTLRLLGYGDAPVHLIKIDVEGYEFAVLQGAKETLKRTAAVVLEYSPVLMRKAGRANAEAIDPMVEAGFESFALDDNGRLRPVSRGELEAVTGQLNVFWLKNKADAAISA